MQSMQSMKLKKELLEKVRSGKKTATTRKGIKRGGGC